MYEYLEFLLIKVDIPYFKKKMVDTDMNRNFYSWALTRGKRGKN